MKTYRVRLTERELELLSRSARFVLAGEWPWENGEEELEVEALEDAADAIEQALSS